MDQDTDSTEEQSEDGNELTTSLPGVEVTTKAATADIEELESLHRRQLEFALEHAEEAKEATRM